MLSLISFLVTAIFCLVLFWPILCYVVLPVIVCTVALMFAMFWGHVEPTSNKNRNVAVIVVASLFFVLSVYFSLIFPMEMAEGEHFRNFIPFLNVSFR